MKHLLLFILALNLLGCASPRSLLPPVDEKAVQAEENFQRKLALDAILNDYQRLMNIAYPLLKQGAFMCENTETTRPVLGWLYGNVYDFESKMRATAKRELKLSETIQVLLIVQNSPMSQADIQVGDQIIGINTYRTNTEEDAGKALHEWIKEHVIPKQAITITLKRDQQIIERVVIPEQSCDFYVRLSSGSEINAYADGKNIIIPRGMMRFAATDDELAVVIAHEIGHNLMEHIDTIRRNAILGFLLDLVAATQGVYTGGAFGSSGRYAYSQGFESEADYISVYLMARNQQDINVIPTFWRKMATQHPRNIARGRGRTHPSTAERFVRLQNAVLEVNNKVQTGELLQPNFQQP